MNDYIIADKKLSLNDLKNLPEFKFKSADDKNQQILLGILYLFAVGVFIISIATKFRIKI